MPTKAASKKLKRAYRKALDLDIDVSFNDPDVVIDPFDAPEFYEPGLVATISSSHDSRILRIYRRESARLALDNKILNFPDEFREEFPDGELPEDDGDKTIWFETPWFELLEEQETPAGPVLHPVDVITLSLDHLVESALDIYFLSGENS